MRSRRCLLQPPRRRRFFSFCDTYAKGIVRTKQQCAFGHDIRRACNAGNNTPVRTIGGNLETSLEDTAEDTLLLPHFTRCQLTIGMQAGKLGAGACAAGRTIVGLSWAENEVGALRRA